MAWSTFAQVLWALVAATIAGSATAASYDISLNKGDTLSTIVVTGYNVNVPCHLETPKGDIIEFRPENQSTDRITYIETVIISYCGASITNLTEDDEGEWTIYYTNGDERISNIYSLTIGEADRETDESEDNDIRDEDVTEWLRVINLVTRTGLTVDIALSKKDDTTQEERFSVITPSEEVLWLDNANIPGVTVHGASDFVATRITIGPIMDESMLGHWTLCGEIDENIIAKRCQPVIISWNDVSNPIEEWNTTYTNPVDIVTNYNALVNVTVRGSGTLHTCHVITPTGDDLTLNSESAYPGITFITLRETTMCTVTLSPIHRPHIGDWVLYATFTASRGRNEVHMPFTLFLYNEDDPYSQAYNVTTLNPLTQVLTLGTTTTLSLSGSGDTDSCEITSPSGESFDLQSSSGIVNFLSPNSNVRCRVEIGPLGLNNFGEWLFIAKFNNRGVFTESRQIVNILLKDEEVFEQINIVTRTDLTVDISLGRKEIDSLDEKFTLTAPDNQVYSLENANIPGVTVHGRSEFVDVRVTIGPMDATLIGRWSLCGEIDVGAPITRCQPVDISWHNANIPSEQWNVTELALRDTVTNYGASVTSDVRGSGTLQTCHLITPEGEDLVVSSDSVYPGVVQGTANNAAICNVTIGPIHQHLIGEWVLRATFLATAQRGGFNEVRLPLNLFLYDEDDPYSQAYNVTNLNPLTQMLTLGTTTTLSLSGSGDTDSCEITSPSGESFDLQSSSGIVNFLSPSSNVRCRVEIGPLGLNNFGEWLFIAKFNNRGVFTESRQIVNILLQDEELLQQINIVTRTDLTVDISLGRKEIDSIDEKFTLTAPDNQVYSLENANIPGVTVHGRSEFVDVRVTIGPMDATLIGRWSLCGEIDVGASIKRCQPVVISWHNANIPSEQWNVTELALRDTVTNYGASVTSDVRGSGTLQTCHLITPEGEDLVVSSDSVYPGVVQGTANNAAICNVTIGPIHQYLIGEWVLRATFLATAQRGGFNEVRLPLNLFLYDEDDPYSQAYNVTNLNPLTQVLTLGTTTTLSLSGSGDTDSCEITSPSGESFDLQSSSGIVNFLSPNSNVRCRVEIGPLGLNNFGEWLFIAKFNNRGVFTESRQIVNILLQDEELLQQINIVTRTDLTVDISLGRKEIDSIDEKFTLTAPDNQVYSLENANIPGVTVHGRSEFVDVRVTIGPMDATLIGRWSLCGEIDVGASIKRCQPVVISWHNANIPSEQWNVTELALRDTVTSYGVIVTSDVRGSGTLQTCHLITPEGEDLVVSSDSVYPGVAQVTVNNAAICNVTIGPIHQHLIGEWVLRATYLASAQNGGFNEVRLPLNVFLYDEDNPYSQAYNVTTEPTITRVINLGTSLEYSLSGSGSTDSCEVRNPSGQLYNLQNATSPVVFGSANSNVRCRVTLGPFENGIFGEWTFNAKFNNRGIFTEIRQPIIVLLEDPENPIIEDHRDIILRDLIHIVTSVGEEHTIIADPTTNSRDVTESCHIRTPSGLQYTIMEGFNLPGIQLVTNSNNRCIINVHVESPEFLGEWVLISREQRSSQPVEVRQPFTIYVEETVDASASEVTVAEGNDLYLRLANPTSYYDSCRLLDPSGTERTDRELDSSHVETCGFIVRGLQSYDSGVWQIRYRAQITFVANIKVEVKDQWEATHESIVLPRGTSVNETIGPENAVYCKLTDPTQRVIFEGHGRCILALDTVANHHIGTWAMNVAYLGNMLTRTYHFDVVAEDLGEKPVVTTYVAKEQPEVILKCSVSVEYEVKSCLFHEPSGQVIIVNDGVAEDKYVSHGSGTTVEGNVTKHECGIRITDPAVADLGVWRCAVQTEHETYYGFLTVVWAMLDPEVSAAVISEPTLSAREEVVTSLEGEPLAMSCSIQSPIRYCYFRRSDGSTYSVTPGISSDIEYVGSGFDAGECGIRFGDLLGRNYAVSTWPQGGWSCHVGLPDGTEQRASFQVEITLLIEVNQYLSDGILKVEGEVYHQQALEYCRYVRIDGIGFTSGSLPDARYTPYEDMSSGRCGISIESPTVLDHHPWIIAAKIIGKIEEVMSVTTHTLEMPTPEPTPEPTPHPTEPTPEPIPDHSPETTAHPEPLPELQHEPAESSNVWLWLTVSLSGVLFVLVVVLFTKNRKSVIARATSWRDSIRRSLTKKPLVVEADHDGTHTTPISA